MLFCLCYFAPHFAFFAFCKMDLGASCQGLKNLFFFLIPFPPHPRSSLQIELGKTCQRKSTLVICRSERRKKNSLAFLSRLVLSNLSASSRTGIRAGQRVLALFP